MVKFTEREASNYRATFTKLDTNKTIVDRETGEDVVRWLWVFTEKVPTPGTDGIMDTLTSPSLGARTNGLKFFTGMLGRPPTKTDDTDDLIGKEFWVTWGPNQNGRLTITAVTKIVDPLPETAPEPVSLGALPVEAKVTTPKPLQAFSDGTETPQTPLPNMVPAGELP